MKIIQYFFILAIAVTISSCVKDGPVGPQGENGANGVANINTQQFSVGAGGWTAASATVWTATFAESDITNIASDGVEAYWSISSLQWNALPVSNLILVSDQLSYSYNNGNIIFTYSGNTEPPSFYSAYATMQFKVTVIPPSLQVKYPNVNWKNATQALQVPEVRAALTK